MVTTTLTSYCPWKTLVTFYLRKKIPDNAFLTLTVNYRKIVQESKLCHSKQQYIGYLITYDVIESLVALIEKWRFFNCLSLATLFGGSGERGNTAMKLFPCCCHFQIISVGTTAIFNLVFTAIKVQISYQILIKLHMQKFFYKNPGNIIIIIIIIIIYYYFFI